MFARCNRAIRFGLFSSLFVSGLSVVPAYAQESDGSGITLLDPVIVTALKRTDVLEELPASGVVLDSDSFATIATDPEAAITRAAPNFYFGGFGQPGTGFVNMRGIGPLGQPANSLDNSVGFATNGAATSAFGFPPSLLDVERIEVLRGPQGTLFGRNALGGVVNVVTRPADGEREFSVTGEYGTDEYYLGEAKIGGWINEGILAGRGAIRFQSRDGDVPNAIVGGHEGDTEISAARGTLKYTPDSSLSVNVVIGYDEDKRSNNYNMLLETPNFPVSGSDIIPDNDRERFETTLEIEKKFENFTFTSTTNYQDISLYNRVDVADSLLFDVAFGFIPANGSDLSVSDDNEQIFSQELRLNSREDARISWVTGLYLFKSEYDSFRNQDSSFSPYSSGLFDTEIDSETVSVFGDVTLPVTQKMKFSTGLRLSHDSQDMSIDYTGKGFPGTIAAYMQDGHVSDTYLTGRGALSYDWSEELMTYASISHGYASGGFEKFTLNAPVGQPTIPFAPSKGWTYEIGAKKKLNRDNSFINFSAFYNDIRDGQLVAANFNVTPVTFSFINQDYDSYGLELEGRLQLTRNLSVHGGIGLTKAEIKNVPATAPAGVVNGNLVPNAPEITASVEAEYRFWKDFYARAQYQHVGARMEDAQNSGELDAFNIVNGRIGWGDQDFSVYAFANNLLDERPEYFGATYSPSVHTRAVGPGRFVGFGINKKF